MQPDVTDLNHLSQVISPALAPAFLLGAVAGFVSILARRGSASAGTTTTREPRDRMEANPKGDWSVEDVRTVCNAYGLIFTTPKRGSHCTITHAALPEILSVPARRLIKPVYIRHFVKLVRRVIAGSEP